MNAELMRIELFRLLVAVSTVLVLYIVSTVGILLIFHKKLKEIRES